MSKPDYRKWMDKEDRIILGEVKKQRNKEVNRMRKEWKKNSAIEKAERKRNVGSRIRQAIRDRHVGDRQDIRLLDGESLRYWEDLAKSGDKDAQARVNAYKIQARLKGESIWKEGAEHTGEPRFDLLKP